MSAAPDDAAVVLVGEVAGEPSAIAVRADTLWWRVGGAEAVEVAHSDVQRLTWSRVPRVGFERVWPIFLLPFAVWFAGDPSHGALADAAGLASFVLILVVAFRASQGWREGGGLLVRLRTPEHGAVVRLARDTPLAEVMRAQALVLRDRPGDRRELGLVATLVHEVRVVLSARFARDQLPLPPDPDPAAVAEVLAMRRRLARQIVLWGVVLPMAPVAALLAWALPGAPPHHWPMWALAALVALALGSVLGLIAHARLARRGVPAA